MEIWSSWSGAVRHWPWRTGAAKFGKEACTACRGQYQGRMQGRTSLQAFGGTATSNKARAAASISRYQAALLNGCLAHHANAAGFRLLQTAWRSEELSSRAPAHVQRLFSAQISLRCRCIRARQCLVTAVERQGVSRRAFAALVRALCMRCAHVLQCRCRLWSLHRAWYSLCTTERVGLGSVSVVVRETCVQTSVSHIAYCGRTHGARLEAPRSSSNSGVFEPRPHVAIPVRQPHWPLPVLRSYPIPLKFLQFGTSA